MTLLLNTYIEDQNFIKFTLKLNILCEHSVLILYGLTSEILKFSRGILASFTLHAPMKDFNRNRYDGAQLKSC